MNSNQEIFNKIAEALLIDYTSVYYVNAVTNEYVWFSKDDDFHSLCIAQTGEDFFVNLVKDADKVIYEEDKHIFMRDMTKEKLIAQMEKGDMQNIEYRLMIDGRPVYHTLRLIRGPRGGDEYFILGVLNIDKDVRRRQKEKQLLQQNRIYNQIADSLAEHYDTLYYVDTDTDNYFEVSSSDVYKSLEIKPVGGDFFGESAKNLERLIHPDDAERVMPLFTKPVIIDNLRKNKTYTLTYRLVIADGTVMNVRCSQIWASDRKHLILCIENINEEVEKQKELIESRRNSKIYVQVAESLATHYDVIYYVDSLSDSYLEFTVNPIFGSFYINEEGGCFFDEALKNSEQIIFADDRDRIQGMLNKDYLISALEDKKQFSVDYRMVPDGNITYNRMTIMWASDRKHFIIGVQNIDEEIKREKERIKALNQANELARRDELTGTRNKTAYHELEEKVQDMIKSGAEKAEFAIVVCDINGLKHVNDTQGHKAGDEYIRSSCKLICNTFAHSPVFRIGGDEFVVFVDKDSYIDKQLLLDRLQTQVMEYIKKNSGPVIASGMASFERGNDKNVSDVFGRADAKMYENKLYLKEMAAGKTNGSSDQDNMLIPITTERSMLLDRLFEALTIISDGVYIFVCDMKHNYSRWSKNAVEHFGLPSEYMYNMGDLWTEKIHPDDKETYQHSIEELFTGKALSHYMQYRAVRPDGGYDLCTCRGIVMHDKDGNDDYFCGSIMNHSLHGSIDQLTGLRNQYGFFEDIQWALDNKKPGNIVMVGISKLSEINEIYGYNFGNRVLQTFGRYLYDQVGNDGMVYRLDGTKFAVMTKMSVDEIEQKYIILRKAFRAGTSIDDKYVILDLNAGLITVDNFNIDHRTVYGCLNYIYGESKHRRHGDLVVFCNDLNDENKHRLEKFHVIRASIMNNNKGFYLLYQPVVDSHTEKLIGAEALIRWRSDEYGIVPPDHFIPLLEKDPLFPDLGEWIIKTALTNAKIILEKVPEFMINVNLSYTQLEMPNFIDMVVSVLDETGFPPQNLCFEITERCRLLDMELLKNVTVNLRGRGVKVALDDFGTGFSSIGIVKNLPLDYIKIDRSFVRNIEKDDKDRRLIESIAAVASTYGAEVCVEGIETEGMKAILQKYSVHSFQGYYYAKPLEFDEFIKWNKNRGSV
ncbi:MAG: EAL domain-containing protein [Oscillospiraceae bacterium]|nr:EAL domain-containing protein [Oscillospiraceae bacterium]